MPEGRRAFMMGNALVVGLIERVGAELMARAPSAADRGERCRSARRFLERHHRVERVAGLPVRLDETLASRRSASRIAASR